MNIKYRKNDKFFFLQFTFSFDFNKTLKDELLKHISKNFMSENWTYDIIDISLVEKNDMKYAVVGVAYSF